jgi:hypothetical protein
MYREKTEKTYEDKDGKNEILAIYEGNFVRFYKKDGDQLLDEDVLIVPDFEVMTKEEGWKELK